MDSKPCCKTEKIRHFYTSKKKIFVNTLYNAKNNSRVCSSLDNEPHHSKIKKNQ